MNMKKQFFLICFLLCIYSLFSVHVYAEIDHNIEGHVRWYINYANYLVEVGRYPDALEYFETAYELSSYSKNIIDALMAKANLLAAYLENPEQALKVYQYLHTKYHQKADVALYRQGFVLYNIGRLKDADEILNKYLSNYPKGRYRYQSEAILTKIKSQIIPKPYIITQRPKVRIRLCRNTEYVYVKTNTNSLICSNSIGCKKKYDIQISNDELMVNNKHNNCHEIKLTSEYPINIISEKYNKTVRGSVIIKLIQGSITVINEVDIEDYLLSVIPSESYPSWPIESLKAQAVAARTYATYQIEHRKEWLYDMVDNAGDQCYGGVEKEHNRTTHAVKSTEGMILTYNNKTILAMYCANNGGFTADVKAIFNLNKKPYLKAQKDSKSIKGKMAKWKRTYSSIQVESALNKIGIYCTKIQNILPESYGPSGRVIKIKITHSKGSNIYRTRPTLCRALNLPDILFDIKKSGQTYYINGRGYGHGVGYSQWGGRYMGDNMNYKDIVSFYYPGTNLEKHWYKLP